MKKKIILTILFIIIILSFGVGYYPLTPSQVLKAFLSKFDDIIELFYQAAEEQVLEEKNIVDYHNISLTQNELIELNNTIKYKIEEIIHKRKSEDEELQYDIVMVSIPVQKKETCNL